jgi:hypothetical protein
VNSIAHGHIESDARHSSANDVTTGVVVIHMAVGDVALVRTTGAAGNIWGWNVSSFAGWLLFQQS